MVQKQSADYWSFLSAFSWELWLAIVATSLAVGLVVWGLDRWSMPPPRERPPLPILYAAADFGDGAVREVAASAADLDRYLWEAISRPMGTRSMIAFTFSSNLVILSWSFAVLVLTILYTASTTSNMTANRLLSTIRGISDLPGRVRARAPSAPPTCSAAAKFALTLLTTIPRPQTVGTDSAYVDVLRKFGVNAIDFPWNNLEDEAAMFEALRSGRIAALVLDESFLRYTAASTCNIAIVGAWIDIKCFLRNTHAPVPCRSLALLTACIFAAVAQATPSTPSTRRWPSAAAPTRPASSAAGTRRC